MAHIIAATALSEQLQYFDDMCMATCMGVPSPLTTFLNEDSFSLDVNVLGATVLN